MQQSSAAAPAEGLKRAGAKAADGLHVDLEARYRAS
jgi:hypothetical protein